MDNNSAVVVMEHAKDVSEWAQKIVEIYMSWYTFFGASNMVALGWIFGTKLESGVKRTIKPVVALFCLLNVVGTVTTMWVGFTVRPVIAEFGSLIMVAAVGNSIALIGFACVWFYCWRRVL